MEEASRNDVSSERVGNVRGEMSRDANGTALFDLHRSIVVLFERDVVQTFFFYDVSSSELRGSPLETLYLLAPLATR